MICNWDCFIRLLPLWLRQEVDLKGRTCLLELRLRVGLPPELVCSKYTITLSRNISVDDIAFCINTASKYSPWSATTVSKGYITAPGGHRIGICGDAVISSGNMTGIRTPTMLCMRVARDFPGISQGIPIENSSVLIIGRPGSGKTTLLRDLIRQQSNKQQGSIGVVDERGELFPTQNNNGFPTGPRTDVISGCSKKNGIELLLRCMGPTVIAVDEITSKEDCVTLLHAAWCGVNLFATAHAGSIEDLFSRPVYRPLLKQKIFNTLVIANPDKTWKLERTSL